MRFTPKTEDELNPVFEKGSYEFLVKNAEDAVSKNTGKDMIKLTIQVWHPDGRSILVNDYLMESVARKLWNFCFVGNLLSLYESGELTAHDCIGVGGVLKLRVEEDKTGQYPDKNAVSDYVVEKAKPEPAKAAKGDLNKALQEAGNARSMPEPSDDDIPF